MPLYSSDTLSNAVGGKEGSGLDASPMPEDSFTPKAEAAGAWCYLFVHYTKVELIRSKLNQKFNTFVHRSVTFKRVKGRIKKEVRPTISGLIFVQGNAREVEALLRSLSPALHLASDCTTGAVAQIADSVMQAFIQLSQFEPARIRFMPHALGYYATGHPLVRVTSGLLAGFEGYQVRISRDKCLVTSVGGMTVAIGGVCKETFENVEAYVNLRRSQQEDTADAAGQTPTQEAVGRCFFRPQSQLDLLALGSETAQSLGLRVEKMRVILLALAAGLAGAAVSVAGLIGFVGLIVPHLIRRFLGEESRPLVIGCAFGGAALLTVCDTAARTLFAPYEIPVGVVLSLGGGPFFLWLLLRRKGGQRH